MPKRKPRPKRVRRQSQLSRVAWGGRLWAILLAVAALAFVLRALHLLSSQDTPPRTVLLTNEARYDAWARAIVTGDGPLPPFDQPPAYPWLVGAIYRFTGANISHVLWLQALADTAHCVLLGWLGGRYFGTLAGLLTGGMAALYGPFIYHSAELLPATLALDVLSAACACTLLGLYRLAALGWAIATLLRPELVGSALLVSLVAYFRGKRRAIWAAGGAAVAAVLLGSVVVSIIAGRPLPYSTGAGLNLWLGNNPAADGTSPFVPASQRGFAERVRFEAQGDAWHADRAFFEAAVGFWREFPAAALELAWKKFRWTLVHRELPNTVDLDWALSYSPLFHFPLGPLGFGPLLLLGAVGALLVARRLAPLWPFAAASAATLLLCTVFFTNARFRLPLAPLLILLAGAGCAEACNRLGSHAWRDLPGRTVLSALFVGAVAAWLTFSDPYGVRTYKNPALIANAGVAERLAGHPQRAQAYLLEAVTLDPTDELAWIHLALAREETGNAPAALEALLTARRHLGRSADLENAAQSFFARHGLTWERWQAYGAAAPAAQAAIARELSALLALPPRPEQGRAGGDPVDSRRQKP